MRTAAILPVCLLLTAQLAAAQQPSVELSGGLALNRLYDDDTRRGWSAAGTVNLTPWIGFVAEVEHTRDAEPNVHLIQRGGRGNIGGTFIATIAEAETQESQLAALGGFRIIAPPTSRVRPFARIMGGWAWAEAPATVTRTPLSTSADESVIAFYVNDYVDESKGLAITADAGARIDLSPRLFVSAAAGWQSRPQITPIDGEINRPSSREAPSRSEIRVNVSVGWEFGR